MAGSRISTVTRETLRADLRIRLNEITPKEFLDPELNRWLNLGCYEVALQLTNINTNWFLDEDDLTDQASQVTYLTTNGLSDGTPFNIRRIDKVTWTGGAGHDVIIPLVEIDELEGYDTNPILCPTSGALPGEVCAHFGNALYFSSDWIDGIDPTKITLTHVKRPAKMTADTGANSYMDALREHQDLVIMFAQKIAMFKKGLVSGRAQLVEDIAGRLQQIRNAYLGQMASKDVARTTREGSPTIPR